MSRRSFEEAVRNLVEVDGPGGIKGVLELAGLWSVIMAS